MKTFIALALISFNVFAAPVKTCSTVLSMPGEASIPTKFEMMEGGVAVVTQKIEGESSSYEDKYVVEVNTVREGLTENSDDEALNTAEKLIVHAMTLENDPVFEGKLRTGVKLKNVRSAKVYLIGEVTNMGGTAVVEASDKNGKALGSFLGGFLISACK
ncbi:MAG: hypothetical protein V4598_14795 [Bdellovibrionota bacterium]